MMYNLYLKIVIKLMKLMKKDPMKYKVLLYRKRGIKIGERCRIFSDLKLIAEPYLVEIGDNVTISTNVNFVTHDNSIIKIDNAKYTDLFGRITVKNNCFIGANSIILPGVYLEEGTVVAAGSVVSKSVRNKNTIIGGNPAKVIGNTKDYIEKNDPYGFNCKGLSYSERKKLILDNEEKLIIKKDIK